MITCCSPSKVNDGHLSLKMGISNFFNQIDKIEYIVISDETGGAWDYSDYFTPDDPNIDVVLYRISTKKGKTCAYVGFTKKKNEPWRAYEIFVIMYSHTGKKFDPNMEVIKDGFSLNKLKA